MERRRLKAELGQEHFCPPAERFRRGKFPPVRGNHRHHHHQQLSHLGEGNLHQHLQQHHLISKPQFIFCVQSLYQNLRLVPATLFLQTRVGPPSGEFCRTIAIFPQVDYLRFINPWEAQDEDGLSQKTLQPNNKESLVSPTHPIQWQIVQVHQFGEEMVIQGQYGQQIWVFVI